MIALSACLSGEVNESLLAGEYERARNSAYRLRDIFGKGNFFLEVQDQGLEVEKRINQEIVRLSKETGIPLVATNDCHYLTQADARAQEVLLCIQTGKTMGDTNRMKFPTDQFYFKTAEEMAHVFREVPDSVERTWAIAERCNVKIEQISDPFPEFQLPPGESSDTYFEKIAREGFTGRVPFLEAIARAGQLRKTLAEYETRPERRNPHDPADEILRLLPRRVGLHSLRAIAGDTGRPGPRFGRRKPGQLRSAHYGCGPAAIRLALRALSES